MEKKSLKEQIEEIIRTAKENATSFQSLAFRALERGVVSERMFPGSMERFVGSVLHSAENDLETIRAMVTLAERKGIAIEI